MNWREYRPDVGPTNAEMLDAGFPRMLSSVTKPDIWRSAILAQVEKEWWDKLDQYLKRPHDLVAWESPGSNESALTLTLMAKRIWVWRHMPLGRGVVLHPVQYIEARQLNNAKEFAIARDAGTLVVGGVGDIEYSRDRSVDTLLAMAAARARSGGLTMWQLAPSGTQPSVSVCKALIRHLGERGLVFGTPVESET
jgi:hypothetical protein